MVDTPAGGALNDDMRRACQWARLRRASRVSGSQRSANGVREVGMLTPPTDVEARLTANRKPRAKASEPHRHRYNGRRLFAFPGAVNMPRRSSSSLFVSIFASGGPC